jgi:PAS domain S-box-containing protein
VRAAAAPILGPNGEILGAVAVLTDMTRVHTAGAERERLLAELTGERTLLRTVLDQMPAAVFIVEAPSGRVLALNDEVARVWGEPRPLTDAVGRYSEEWVGYHADGRRVASEEWPVARATLAGETVTDWVCEIERPDGARVTIQVSAAPVRDAAGRTVAAVAVAADVTARTQAARERDQLVRALELERARLAYVFRQAPSFLAVLRSPTHIFEFVNAAYTQLVGHRDLVGKTVAEALPEVRGQGFVALLDGVLATGQPFVGREVPISLARTPDAVAEVRFVDFVYLPVVEADGTRSGVIAHGSDVTEQVQARHEIERLLAESERARRDAETARGEAQLANRAKGEFLAVMSHELRTPLNAIGGYAELLEMGIRGPVTEQQREDLSRIQRSQRHLLGLVNEVLNYAKLESGSVRYAAADVAVHEAVADAAALVAPQARAKGLALGVRECRADADGRPLAVRADPEKFRQVLVNLLSNAIKFTDLGGAELFVTCDDDAGTVAIRVRDTGIGIPADKLGVIFDPFVQVRADLTRTADGAGLGLAISRDLARGMGGDLTAESAPGVGSTFTLTLPAAPAAA